MLENVGLLFGLMMMSSGDLLRLLVWFILTACHRRWAQGCAPFKSGFLVKRASRSFEAVRI